MLRLEYNAVTRDCDLAVDDFGGLRVDGGLETLALASLLIDARPGAQDVQSDPAGAASQRMGGWWAHDLLPPDARGARSPGSLLHRLSAFKANAATARRAERWGEQALGWMVEEQLADRITTEAVVGPWSLNLQITGYRGNAQLFRQTWTSLVPAAS